MKKLTVSLLLAFVLVGCGQKSDKKVENKEIIRPVKYELATKSKEKLNMNFSGSLKPSIESVLSFKIPGTIQKMYVRLGDRVKKDQLLAVLDDSNYKLELQRAEAGLEQAKAGILQVDSKIAEAQTGIAQAKTGIVQASSAVDRAKAAHEQALSVQKNAKQEFERFRELFLNDNVAQNVYDAAKSGLEQANAAVEQAKAAIAQAEAAYEQSLAMKNQTEAGLEQAKAAKKAAEAQLNSIEKQLELAKLQLSYTELRAPVAGTIALQQREVNENIGAGTPVFILNAGKKLQAEIYVSEAVINRINVKDQAIISIGSQDKTIVGTVVEVGSSSTGFGGTYPVKINIDSNDTSLKAGMSVEVRLKSSMEERFITLPLVAVKEDNEGKNFVFVVSNMEGKTGSIEKKIITIGKVINDRAEILSGISEDEKVVTAGTSKVVEGQKVKLYEEVN